MYRLGLTWCVIKTGQPAQWCSSTVFEKRRSLESERSCFIVFISWYVVSCSSSFHHVCLRCSSCLQYYWRAINELSFVNSAIKTSAAVHYLAAKVKNTEISSAVSSFNSYTAESEHGRDRDLRTLEIMEKATFWLWKGSLGFPQYNIHKKLWSVLAVRIGVRQWMSMNVSWSLNKS